MNVLLNLAEAVEQPGTGLYLRCLAVVLTYGALVHIGNMLGWTGKVWLSTPLHWRVMDVVLLAFNATAAIGLWLRGSNLGRTRVSSSVRTTDQFPQP